MKFKSGEETVGWIRDRYQEGNLDLKPPYQRNPVWVARQKNHLVESVLMNAPIPEVFIQRDTDADGNTQYHVVDGQQRITALLQFVGTYNGDDDEEFDGFALEKIDADSQWFKKSFGDLTVVERRAFWGYEIAVRYLDSSSEDEMKAVFRRLNTFTVPLKPQELRHATYSGPFAKLADRLAERHGDFLAENRIITVASIRRMADVEFTAELLVGVMHGPQGGTPSTIDEYYREFEDFENEIPGQRRTTLTFEQTLKTISDLEIDLRGSRWGYKSDFYSLFVALAAKFRVKAMPTGMAPTVVDALERFASEIDQRVADDEAPVSEAAIIYTRNVQRAPNEKSRRVARHREVVALIDASLNAGRDG